MGTAPAPAEGTSSIEPASGAERAAAARPEAMEPRAYDEAERRHEMAPQGMPTDGKRDCFKRCCKGERMAKAPPQGSPNEGEGNTGLGACMVKTPLHKGSRKPEALPRARARMCHDATRQPD